MNNLSPQMSKKIMEWIDKNIYTVVADVTLREHVYAEELRDFINSLTDEAKHTFWDKLVGNDDWDKKTGRYNGLDR